MASMAHTTSRFSDEISSNENRETLSRRGILSALAAIPSVGVPALAYAAVAAPSDLGQACLWATSHRGWIDVVALGEDWGDDRLSAECRRVDDVITRAILEPSASLSDVRAKACLALEDFERFSVVPGEPMDDGDRIVLTVLREIVALAGH